MGEPELLASCYRSSLEIALQKGIKTIAFPSISTGVYRFPLELASEIAVNEIIKFIYENDFFDEVYIVCFDDKTYKAYSLAYSKAVI